MPKRFEHKYWISWSDYMQLKPLLRTLFSFDPNTDHNGEYNIESVYFDSPDVRCIREKEDGLEFRKKYRARCYNSHQSTEIKFEIKYRNKFQIWKNSVKLNKQEYLNFLHHRVLPVQNDFTKELIHDAKTLCLRPVVIVRYTREVYVYPTSNVRITFDKYLSHSHFHTDIFQESPHIFAHSKDKLILEIKYNQFLPHLVERVFSNFLYKRDSISKYLLCYKHSRRIFTS